MSEYTIIRKMCVKEFESKMENLTHVPLGKENVRTERPISLKCLIYGKPIMLECSEMVGSWLGGCLISTLESFVYGFQRHEQEITQGGLVSQNWLN